MITRRTAAIGIIAALAQPALAQPALAQEFGKAVMLPAHARPVRTLQFRAAGDGPRPSVLILHGAGGFDRRLALYNKYAANLAAGGMDAYLVYYYAADDTGAGDEFKQQY